MCDRVAFMLMFMSLPQELDFQIVPVDGSFVKVHRLTVGARSGERDRDESRTAQAIGKTKGGLNRNLLALADKNGRLERFSLLTTATRLSAQPSWPAACRHVGVSSIDELLGDKAYDSQRGA